MLRRSALARTRRPALVLVLIASGLVLTGCTKITGGGWIPSQVPGEKATFGFTARCANTTVFGVPAAVLHDGQFEFHDHAVGVDVHGDVGLAPLQTFPGMTCKQVAAAEPNLLKQGGFMGTYRDQSSLLPSLEGEFAVGVIDAGKPPSASLPDFICVQLAEVGELPFYTNCGDVEGGNVWVE